MKGTEKRANNFRTLSNQLKLTEKRNKIHTAHTDIGPYPPAGAPYRTMLWR